MTTETETVAAPRKMIYAKGPDARGWYWATGRRKTAIARVRIRPGAGTFMVNGKPLEEHLVGERDQKQILAVLDKAGKRDGLEVVVRTTGGGPTGHAGAIMMGLGRAIAGYDPNLEKTMRSAGFLTRDAREVERKKPGQAGARRRYQFSKR